MNMRTQHSGSIAGVVPNPPGNPLPGPLQQNGNIFPSQTQNPGIHCNALNRNLELAKARKYMQAKIYEILMRRSRQSPDLSQKKMIDIVKRLEEGLFRSALSQEEYLNMATLESRLHILIKRPSMNKDNQQFSHASSSLSVGTMIPTPGFPQTVNSVLMSTSMDSSAVSTNGSNTMVSSCINNGSFFLTGNGPSGSGRGGFFNSTDGPSSGVCQQSNAFSINSGGIDLVTSMGVQKIGSQMIPTPGFNHPNNDGVNTDATNQRFMNPESSKNCSMFPNIEASIASLPTQQRTQFDGQNSHSIRNIGVPIGSAIRPTFEQRPKVLSNGPMNGGMGMIGNDISPMNSAETSEGYTTGTMYNNSVQPLLANFDQHHHPIMQGDGYETRAADASESGNFYVPVTSVGSMTNNECLGATTPQSMPKSNSPPMTNAPIIHFTGPAKPLETQSIDHLEKLNHLSQNPEKESDVQHLQHQQLQQPCSPFHHQQIVRLQKQQNENQLLSKNNSFSRPHLSSNIIPDYKSGSEREHRDDALYFQISEPSEFSRNWFQQNSMEDHYRATPFTQNSDQMQQLMHRQHFEANPQNNFKSMSGGTRDDSALCGQGYSNSQDGSHVGETLKHVKTVREDFGHEVSGIGGYQRNNIRSEESVIAQCDASISTEPPAVSSALSRSNYISRERQFKNQQRWLLFLLHARRCSAPEGKCQEPNCILAQKLLAHLDYCNAIKCQFPRCDVTKDLLIHRRHCQDASCPVCIPVKNFVLAQRKAFASSDFRPGLHCNVNGSSKTCNTAEITGRSILKTSSLKPETPEDLEPSRKRVKTEETSKIFVSESERSDALVTDIKSELPLWDAERPEEHDVSHIPVQSASSEIKVEIGGSDWKSNHKSMERKNDRLDDTCGVRTDSDPTLSSNPAGIGSQEVIQVEKEIEQSKPQNILIPCDNASKSGKAKVTGVSLTELFTPEQIQEHIKGLRQWVGQSKAKAEKNQAMEHLMNENSCQLCAVEKLKFEPPPIYCTRCGTRIKRNAMYYTFGAGDTRHYFCIPCYNDARGDTIVVDRTTIPKARVEKKKNDDEIVEPWVQCDKCEAWQHQICALFNGKRNDGQAEYTCPNCYIEEVERGERVPLPRSAVLGAKDLPKTILSDHLEQRLFSRLKHERQERALLQGKAYDEVPGAEALVVRVVSSVDKKLEVKPRFFEIFQDQNYPTEFPYKSKVILLFQNIEGVEVCLFGMYVQEFGSECQQPNHRRVYLAYLDSVKYFRPDVRAVTGEALRTFVYHEILIGYLDYCKKRGFTSCYIWACPPMKGEDYILYCHPEIQKTPKSDKLREWYLSMLKKAERENIVVGLTNLYDHFFVCTGESRAKVTAARLPYFDGDYWPGSAEDIIYQLQQEDDGTKQHQKGNLKKSIIKRALKASGQTDLTGSTSKDLLLLHKLGETISPMKEDFIMVHLQHACTHCCILMISGNRWVCKRCKNFQLCDKCYDAEQKRDDRERHPVNHKDKHVLHPVQIIGVPDDTKDRDDILESEFFDTRHAFLNLCQGNHYQYDTLRRAKHSSMMILYHLHNPTAPAFVATCCICRLDIESGQGWRCETCLDYNVCNTCYQREGGIDHPHILTNNLSNDRDVQNIEARELRVVQLRKMLDLVVHASVCHSPSCQYPNCRGVKGLFHHAKLCKKRAVGGCVPCRRMWRILQIHSQTCKESECRVPRCRDLRVHVRRLQQQSESRRRAAATEMMRQRALEIAGCS